MSSYVICQNIPDTNIFSLFLKSIFEDYFSQAYLLFIPITHIMGLCLTGILYEDHRKHHKSDERNPADSQACNRSDTSRGSGETSCGSAPALIARNHGYRVDFT